MKANLTYPLASLIAACVVGCSTPSPKVASTHQERPIAAQVEDARVCFETGRLEMAEKQLQNVLSAEPDNAKAHYYLDLVHQAEARSRHPSPRGYYQTIPQQPFY